MLLNLLRTTTDFAVLVARLTTGEFADEQRMVLIEQFMIGVDVAPSRFIEVRPAAIVCDASARTVIVISHGVNWFEHNVSAYPRESPALLPMVARVSDDFAVAESAVPISTPLALSHLVVALSE